MTVTLVVECDGSGDGDFADANENITALVHRASWGHGRKGILGAASPGRLELLLDNEDRRFSPENGTSPLFGLMEPGRTVRVRSTAPFAKTLFVAALDDIEPDPQLDGKTAVLTAYEKSLVKIREAGPIWAVMQTNVGPGQAVTAILDEIGWPVGDRSIDQGTTVMDTWWASGIDALQALGEMVDEDLGYLFVQGDGKLRFEGRAYRATHASDAVAVTFDDTPSSAFRYEGIAYARGIGAGGG